MVCKSSEARNLLLVEPVIYRLFMREIACDRRVSNVTYENIKVLDVAMPVSSQFTGNLPNSVQHIHTGVFMTRF